MKILALDFGSSSIKAAILKGARTDGPIITRSFRTRYDSVRAEVEPREILGALKRVIGELGAAARRVDTIALSVMSPAWVAMDKRGCAITPIVTHQDRRSVEIAHELERRVGKQRYLKLAGNRPFPGSISCTTWAWFLRHAPEVMAKADLCGHLNTFLHRQLTGARIIDPSNASFTGFYQTPSLGGWNDTLIDAVGIKRHRLPQVIGADGIGGFITQEAARTFGLTHGTSVLAGLVDTSAATLLAGARPGQLVNVTGSTDVLALCTERAHPHEKLLTRALGTGKRFVTAATLAAAGSSLTWAHREFLNDLSDSQFWSLVSKLAKRKPRDPAVNFEPYLAGERASVEQRSAAFSGLTLATTRQDLLVAMIDALARASAGRLELLAQAAAGSPQQRAGRIRRDVLVSGGSPPLRNVLRRDWSSSWRFHEAEHATLLGLALLVPQEK